MEAMVLAGKGKTAESLTPADLTAIRVHLPEARAIWSEVTAAHFDQSLFGFNAEKHAAMEKQIAFESDALAQLQAALDSGDPTAVAERAVALKPSFSVLFMLFGDFEGLN
jgi:hypothetical protein